MGLPENDECDGVLSLRPEDGPPPSDLVPRRELHQCGQCYRLHRRRLRRGILDHDSYRARADAWARRPLLRHRKDQDTQCPDLPRPDLEGKRVRDRTTSRRRCPPPQWVPLPDHATRRGWADSDRDHRGPLPVYGLGYRIGLHLLYRTRRYGRFRLLRSRSDSPPERCTDYRHDIYAGRPGGTRFGQPETRHDRSLIRTPDRGREI